MFIMATLDNTQEESAAVAEPHEAFTEEITDNT